MKKGQEPAFPRTMWPGSNKGISYRDAPGMTLRQDYAGRAMQGLVANYKREKDHTVGGCLHWFSSQSFKIADAMIEFEQKEEKHVDSAE